MTLEFEARLILIFVQYSACRPPCRDSRPTQKGPTPMKRRHPGLPRQFFKQIVLNWMTMIKFIHEIPASQGKICWILLTWYNNLMALARTWQLFDAIQECFVFHRIQDSRGAHGVKLWDLDVITVAQGLVIQMRRSKWISRLHHKPANTKASMHFSKCDCTMLRLYAWIAGLPRVLACRRIIVKVLCAQLRRSIWNLPVI